MKRTQFIYTLCIIASSLIFNTQAAVVNYYTSISNLNSSNNFPQGGFIDGLTFSSSFSVVVSGTTYFDVIYANFYCVLRKDYWWNRYLIVPESVKDTTNTLTLNLNGSAAENFLVGTVDGVAHYAYKIDRPYGEAGSCSVGGPFSGPVVATNTTVNFQSTLTKASSATVNAKTYSFDVPVRIVAATEDTVNSYWYSTALSKVPLGTTKLAIAITNFCDISQSKYEFDFGTLTEGRVNEPGFSKESDIKNLDISCVEPANIELSIITANSENGNPNKVKMGNDLVADFYINNTLQNNITFTGVNNIHIPLHANLRKNISSTGQVQAGQYTGASVIKIIFQ